MKLVTFTHNQITRVGAVVDEWIVDGSGNKNIPESMLEFLTLGAPALIMMQALINSGNFRIELKQVKLNAPVPKPEKFLSKTCRGGCCPGPVGPGNDRQR